MIALTDKSLFTNREIINKQMVMVIRYFAKKFTKNDMIVAKKRLDIHAEISRKKDTAILSYFIGFLTVMLPLIICLMLVDLDPDGTNKRDKECQISSLPIFRGTMMGVFLVLGAGLCIQIFREYEINYIYIF